LRRFSLDDVAMPAEPDAEIGVEWFDDLYRTHWDGMVRLAFVMVDDLAIAEELAQDAFTRMFRLRVTVLDPLAYLRSAVYNACRNHHRGERVRRAAPASLVTDAVPMGDHVIDVVRRLPPKRRALVVLRYYSGLTDAEIAETTGLPMGTVKSTLHRALAELRKELS
jgi:DNA-directed RNA polymerase specialized sigma24 family protein